MITRRTPHYAPIAVGAALALVLALGSGVSGQSPSASATPATGAATPIPSACPPAPSAVPGASPGTSTDACVTATGTFTWQQADVPGIDAGSLIPQYMAINGAGDMSLLGNAYPDQSKSRAWHSTDGLTWTAAKLAWGAKTSTAGAAQGLAVLGEGFLTIGDAGDGWTARSPTGETWTVDRKAVDGGKRWASLYAVTSTPDGAAITGTLGPMPGTPVPAKGFEYPQAVWTTTDGKVWKRTSLPDAGTTSAPTAIAATPSGLLAVGAQGHTTSGVADEPPALWIAPDGVRWQSVPLPFVDGDSYLRSLTATASGLLLVINEYRDKKAYAATIWSSTDGLTWHQVYKTEPYVASASYGPLGVVMATDSTLLRSVDDGATWSATPLPASFVGSYNSLLAQTPDGRLVAGFNAPDLSSASLWVGTR
jgi:hypothetical protein